MAIASIEIMANKPHIVLLTPGFPESETDYLCTPPVQLLVKGLRVAHPEIEITVVALQYPYKRDEYYWHGIPVFACGGNNRAFPGRLMVWRQAMKTLTRLQEAQPITCIHALWATEAALLAQRMNKRHNTPVVCTLMGQDARPANTYLKRLKLENMTTVALSRNQATTYEQTTGRKPDALIPWAIDPASLPQPAPTRTIDVLGVGSHIDLKRYKDFLEVVAELKKSQPDLRAVLLGDGPDTEVLKAQATELGLGGNVAFEGLLPRPQVLEFMGRSKVLLHPSEYESFGFVFAEAQALGCNIVSRDTGWNEASTNWMLADSVSTFAAATEQLLTLSGPQPNASEQRFSKLLASYRDVYFRAKS